MGLLRKFLSWPLFLSAALYALFVLFPGLGGIPGESAHSGREELDLREQQHEYLSLDESQCAAAFLGLFEELDRTAQRGRFEVEKSFSHIDGHAQGRIAGGKVELLCVLCF